MIKYLLILLVIIGCNNAPSNVVTSQTSSEKPKVTFPFTMGNDYSLTFGTDGSTKQDSILIKNEYYPNGYCYESHITQMLESLDSELLKHIEFDSEAGAFYARVDSEENQFKIVNLLSPIFSDTVKFEEWVKKANRSKIHE